MFNHQKMKKKMIDLISAFFFKVTVKTEGQQVTTDNCS